MDITRHLLVKNTIINLIGRIIPLPVAVFTIPIIVHGLGIDRYGIYSLILILLGNFSVFDFGFGKGTTKYIAEFLASNKKDKIMSLICFSFLFVFFVSLLISIILYSYSSFFVNSIFKIPENLTKEANLGLKICAILIVIRLLNILVIGVIEGFFRFDLSNLFIIIQRIFPNIIIVIIIKVFKILNISNILVSLLGLELSTFGLGILAILKILKNRNITFNLKFNIFTSFLKFNLWIFVSNIISTILVYLEKILIGIFISTSVLTYYMIPYNLVYKILILPSSLTKVLFPSYSILYLKDRIKFKKVFFSGLKINFLIIGFISIIFIVFSENILVFWLGKEFTRSSFILQCLTVGIFFGSFAGLLGAMVEGSGHPFVSTIGNFLQLPFYLILAYGLIGKYNINGAAIAWTTRMFFVLLIGVIFIFKLRLIEVKDLIKSFVQKDFQKKCFVLFLFLILFLFSSLLKIKVLMNSLLTFGLFIFLSGAIFIKFVFNDEIKKIIKSKN